MHSDLIVHAPVHTEMCTSSSMKEKYLQYCHDEQAKILLH